MASSLPLRALAAASGDDSTPSNATSARADDVANARSVAAAGPSYAPPSAEPSTGLNVPESGGAAGQNALAGVNVEPSTGIAKASYPFQLPLARGSAQPSLGLTYSSALGTREAGWGWGLNLPSIEVRNRWGKPPERQYWSGHNPGPAEYMFGGKVLLPICVVSSNSTVSADSCNSPGIPAAFSGWTYYRLALEGSFARFFLSPDLRTWVIQDKNQTMELGVPLGEVVDPKSGKGFEAVDGAFRWNIVKQYDSRGPAVNTIRYVWSHLASDPNGIGYLTDLYDTPPTAAGADWVKLSANHTHLDWVYPYPATGKLRELPWNAHPYLRLSQVEMTSANWSGTRREFVRRYHLSYDTVENRSYLRSVQMEGRCATPHAEGDATPCPAMPAMRFDYDEPVNAFDSTVNMMSGSVITDLPTRELSILDINGDGLPDLHVPAVIPVKQQTVFFNATSAEHTWSSATDMYVQAPTFGADTVSLKLGNVLVGNWLGDGKVNLLWKGAGGNEIIYTPGQLGGSWAWFGVNSNDGLENKDCRSGNPLLAISPYKTSTDINGDGLPDLVEVENGYDANDDPHYLICYSAKDTNGQIKRFLEPSIASIAEPGRRQPWPVKTAFGDIDGDGRIDIVQFDGPQPNRPSTYYRLDVPPSQTPQPFVGEYMPLPTIDKFDWTKVRFADVTGDGLADLLYVADGRLRLWVNHYPAHFEQTATLDLSLKKQFPGWADDSGVRIADMNGSGVDDLVFLLPAGKVAYIDALNGKRHGLLKHVENGLGATTDLTYATTTQLSIDARRKIDLWKTGAWASETPQIHHVVTRVRTDNNLVNVGYRRSVMEFGYRDPVYDGLTQQFRGFRKVRTRMGVVPYTVESTYFMGSCSASGVSVENCGADNPMEAYQGVPILTETFNDAGVYLSTVHRSYTRRVVANSNDGRRSRFAFPSVVDTYLYGTSAAQTPGAPVTLVDVQNGSELSAGDRDTGTQSSSVILRDTKTARHLRTYSDVDAAGNVVATVDYGEVGVDDPISRWMVWTVPANTSSGWLWRMKTSTLAGNSTRVPGLPPDVPRKLEYEYNEYGELTKTFGWLSGSLLLDRRHNAGGAVAPPPSTASKDGKILLSAVTQYDSFGHTLRVEGAGGRCQTYGFDPTYQQFPSRHDVFADGCDGHVAMSTARVYDRGLNLLTMETQNDVKVSTFSYDAWGRLNETAQPDARTGLPSAVSFHADYLPPDGGTVRRVHVTSSDGTSTHEAWAYVDGWSNPVVILSKGDHKDEWITSSIEDIDEVGNVTAKHRPMSYVGDASAVNLIKLGTQPEFAVQEQFHYDGFGRLDNTHGLDGLMNSQVQYAPLSTTVYDEADIEATAHQATPTTYETDGHGRTVRVIQRTHKPNSPVVTSYRYRASGQLASIRKGVTPNRDGTVNGVTYSRWMEYDSLGRLVRNAEPNTATSFSDYDGAANMKSWRYAYDDAGQLVGTSDARGCGKNLIYDGAGRTVAEDFSPCLASQEPYSPYVGGVGAEVLYRYDVPDTDVGAQITVDFAKGNLSAVYDRASLTRFFYDGRSRVTDVTRRVANPGSVADVTAGRYVATENRQTTTYDAFGRVATQTTGADVAELAPGGNTTVRTQYTPRGLLASIDGAYGSIISNITYEVDGQPSVVRYGDGQTSTKNTYDVRRRLWKRVTDPNNGLNPPSLYEDVEFGYDTVNNPTSIVDHRLSQYTSPGFAPMSRSMTYDDLYRLTRVDYDSKGDVQVPPLAAEEASGNNDPAFVGAQLPPQRIKNQAFDYDEIGNMTSSRDDALAMYDRSVGKITNGRGGTHGGPNQFLSSDGATADGKGTGSVQASYDAAGNVASLFVTRPGCGGACLTSFTYDWDENGLLARARRYDSGHDIATPQADLSFAYNAAGQRVLKSATDPTTGEQRHSVDIFGSLRLNHARWTPAYAGASYGEYERTSDTETVYIEGIARVLFSTKMPRPGLHVFLELGDHLGSASLIIDRDTGTPVERITYQAFGATESDQRLAAWQNFREDYRFSGKEDDAEVGLTYFGARYYAAAIGRWLSADPLAVHGNGGDVNPYAYANGSPIAYVDARGLETGPPANPPVNPCEPPQCVQGGGNSGGGGGGGRGNGGNGGGYYGDPGSTPAGPAPALGTPHVPFNPYGGGGLQNWVGRHILQSNGSFALTLQNDHNYEVAVQKIVGVTLIAEASILTFGAAAAYGGPALAAIDAAWQAANAWVYTNGVLLAETVNAVGLQEAGGGLATAGVGGAIYVGAQNAEKAAPALMSVARRAASGGDPLQWHHVFPRAFREFFEARGILIDEHLIQIRQSIHLDQLHLSKIGTSDGILRPGPGGLWNANWARFIQENPNATKEQIFGFGRKMCAGFGLGNCL
ncbi:MAG: VCBS repeat-containing protein [Actinobacteria bacterium]|nr:VCBS repeat-containing protein [Actinomycetota bacterium]